MNENKEKNFISAVIYVHNQESKIYDFLSSLNQRLADSFEKFEMICVNDGSTDGSVDEIKKFSSKIIGGGVLSLLNMSFYQGVELAMNAGVDLAIGDFVYEYDMLCDTADLDWIMKIYRRSLEGYDIVSAAPAHGQRLVSRLFYVLFNRFSNTQSLLRTEFYRILSRRAINRVHSMSKTIPYRKAVYANCGLKTDIITFDNQTVLSKADQPSTHKRGEVALDAMILYTDLAYRFSIGFSIWMMLSTLLIGIYTLAIYIAGKPVEGWTTTMLFLAFAFLGIFVVLSIIIKYISIILNLNFNRQKYIIESIEKLNS